MLNKGKIMKKTIISFDLDSVIVDITNELLYPVIREYYNDLNCPDEKLKAMYFEFKKSYPEDLANKLIEVCQTSKLTDIKIDPKIVNALNNLIHNPVFDIYFITNRDIKLDTYSQLVNNGIKVDEKHLIVTKDKIPYITTLKSIHVDDRIDIIAKLISLNKYEDVPMPILISNEDTLYNHFLEYDLAPGDVHFNDISLNVKIPDHIRYSSVLEFIESIKF
jgi:hypothetical protein